MRIEETSPLQREWTLGLKGLQKPPQRVLGDRIGVRRVGYVVFCQAAVLHAIFKTSASDENLSDARGYERVEEPVVRRKILVEMEKRFVVRQPGPGEVDNGFRLIEQR